MTATNPDTKRLTAGFYATGPYPTVYSTSRKVVCLHARHEPRYPVDFNDSLDDRSARRRPRLAFERDPLTVNGLENAPQLIDARQTLAVTDVDRFDAFRPITDIPAQIVEPGFKSRHPLHVET